MANQETIRQDLLVGAHLGVGKTAGSSFSQTMEVNDPGNTSTIGIVSGNTNTGGLKFIKKTGLSEAGSFTFNNNTNEFDFTVGGVSQVAINSTAVTVKGDLVVLGTTTTVDSATLEITDVVVVVNKDEVGAGITDPRLFGGIQVDRGSSPDALWGFNESTDWWEPRDFDHTAGELIGFKRLGNIQEINCTTAGNTLVINGTGSLQVPTSTTANRPSPSNGMIRYNTTTNTFEGVVNGAWTEIIDNTNVTAGYVSISGDTMTGNLIMNAANISLNSGSILAANGTASIPSYSFASDTNTGLYWLSDGAASISSNGVDVMQFNSSRLVSFNGAIVSDSRIGISDSGSYATSFTGNKRSQIKMVGLNLNDWGRITFGDGSIHDYASIGVQRTSGGSYFAIGTSNNLTTGLTNQALTIAPNGFVGINVTNPATFQLEVAGDIGPDADLTRNIGSVSKRYGTFYGTATEALYADVAERYESDAFYEPGTVLVFGGKKEVTTTSKEFDVSVAGVVSTKPGVMLNAYAGDNSTHPYIALKGRVPCKVHGTIRKGDLLVTSSRPGYGMACDKNNLRPYTVFAKALESFTPKDGVSQGVIEVVIV